MGVYPGVGESLGRFEILRVIGRGGMGTVFEARQSGFDRLVALKVLSPELSNDPGFRRRFASEAAMLAGLDSPHVISLIDYGEHAGWMYIAMQLVAGQDLAALLTEEGAQEPQRALEIVAQAAEALADAHTVGLIHRDVKPANLLIRDIRGEPFVYLCDFGIAKSDQSQDTRTTGVVGTFGYMAPERHEGTDADERSDIYALGCVLWAALTGHAPYEGTSEIQVAIAHLQQPVPTLPSSLPASRVLNEIIGTSMAKDPDRRYQTADLMRAAARDAKSALRRESLGHLATGPGSEAASSHDQTFLRPGVGLRPGKPDTTKRPGVPTGALLGALTILILLAAAAAGTFLVTGKDAERSSATASSTASTAATPSPSPAVKTSGSPGPSKPPTASMRPKPAPTAQSPTPVEASVALPAPQAASARATPDAMTSAPLPSPPSRQLVCWNGRTATTVSGCGVPQGAQGVASVFPSFDASRCGAAATRQPGKVEVFECPYGSFLIRYSRWDSDIGRRFDYLNESNKPAQTNSWLVDGEASGTTWTSYETPEQDAAENMRHQWAATYTTSPFEVSVEGVDETARDEGVRLVQARRQSDIGLK